MSMATDIKGKRFNWEAGHVRKVILWQDYASHKAVDSNQIGGNFVTKPLLELTCIVQMLRLAH